LAAAIPHKKGHLVATKANYQQCIQPGWSEPYLLQVQDCFVVWGDFALKQNQHGFHPGGSREPSITHGWLIHRSHGCIFTKANDICDTHISPPSFVEKKKTDFWTNSDRLQEKSTLAGLTNSWHNMGNTLW